MKKKDPWFTEIVRVVSWIVFLATIESIHKTTRKGTKKMHRLCSDHGGGTLCAGKKMERPTGIESASNRRLTQVPLAALCDKVETLNA
jgi:hypothetical protein